ncbi:MAG TPA: hypothetical protein VFQ82_06680 [Stellaceae bacterium]|jgi:hypothetical protein|nr:hypothetical protein [Stellaceae bacterium]
MPDETVRFGTGTDRDKALLLHVLVERTLAPDDAASAKVETLFTESGCYVQGPGFCVSTSQMARAAAPAGAIRGRIVS